MNLTTDYYEISYFGFNFHRKSTFLLNRHTSLTERVHGFKNRPPKLPGCFVYVVNNTIFVSIERFFDFWISVFSISKNHNRRKSCDFPSQHHLWLYQPRNFFVVELTCRPLQLPYSSNCHPPQLQFKINHSLICNYLEKKSPETKIFQTVPTTVSVISQNLQLDQR